MPEALKYPPQEPRRKFREKPMNDPQCFDHSVLDHLAETVMRFGSELWATRRRLELLERELQAEAGGLLNDAGFEVTPGPRQFLVVKT